ncbi:MAG: hypothetical protein RL196_1303 [Actinomycetota bacterium]|jgi:hypothetical protein
MVDSLKTRVTNLVTSLWSNWLWRVTLVYVATRIFSAVVFAIMLLLQPSAAGIWPQSGDHLNFIEFMNIWDADWYRKIYEYGFGPAQGYPKVLPLTADGLVSENAWAFMPAYPFLIRILTAVTTLPWAILAPAVSTIFGWVFSIFAYKLFARRFNEKVALWSLTLLLISAAAPILQTGYAESMGLALLAGALLLIIDRKYLLAIAPLTVLAFTRPGVLAMAAALAGLFVTRWWQARHRLVEFAFEERLRMAILGATTFALGFAWSQIVTWYTGVPEAYMKTELYWRLWISPGEKFIPFDGWLRAGGFYFGSFLGPTVVLALLGFIAMLMFTRSVRDLGLEMRWWAIGYILYLVAVFYPQSSTFRLFLPAFVLFGAFGRSTYYDKKWIKWGIVILSIATQVLWVGVTWHYEYPDFTPP